MCGIVGIVAQDHVNQELFDALTVLQHRGQDAAGIVTCDNGHLKLCKRNGMVREVFHTRHMIQLTGPMGIGHVRYPTAGTDSQAEAQPFYVNSPYGISMAHNGNLTNADALKEELFRADARHINTDSDSEIILNILANALQKGRVGLSPTPEDFFQAVAQVHARCRGAYAVVAMITDVGILAFRDPHGIRPLCLGKRTAANGQDEYMLASESVALGSGNFTLVGDVAPGEAVFIDKAGNLSRHLCTQSPKAPCIFEFVYLARSDSVMEGASIYNVRLSTGEALAKDIQKQWPTHDIDVVIPVPETSRSSAMSLAHALDVPFREGFVKNRYIGRTFIMPGQATRKKSVRQKLNAMPMEFKDKNVLIVDDSIVRGTTSSEIIQMARESGAKSVYFASASPPIRYPNIYGIDMPVSEELVAYNRTPEEVAKVIGADKLFYLSLEDLVSCLLAENPDSRTFDTSIFDGQYVTGDESRYLSMAAKRRADSAKSGDKRDQSPLDLHNHSS